MSKIVSFETCADEQASDSGEFTSSMVKTAAGIDTTVPRGF